MGYSTPDWHGVFYPEKANSRSYLPRYSEIFDTVELDTTFYGTPRRESVQRWVAQTPTNFCFCAKVPRAITHDARLALNALPLLYEFVSVIQGLGDKLGALLLQLPPDFTPASQNQLALFLAKLPSDVRFALEFRHPAWFTPVTAQRTSTLLQVHKVAWCATEYVLVPGDLYQTTDFLYLRWIGAHGQFPHPHNHEIIDSTTNLQAWLLKLQPVLPNVKHIYGFFNNEYANFAPASCQRLQTLLGMPIKSYQPNKQTRFLI